MTTPTELTKIGETGKQDFAAGRYEAAAEAFRAAAEGLFQARGFPQRS